MPAACSGKFLHDSVGIRNLRSLNDLSESLDRSRYVLAETTTIRR